MYTNLVSIDRSVISTSTTRKPSFWRTVKALFKKTWLNKIRYPAAIVELIGAVTIFNLVWPIHAFARKNYVGDVNPPINYTGVVDMDLLKFLFVTKEPAIVARPDTPRVHALMDPLLSKIQKNFTVRSSFVNTSDEMNSFIYERDANGLAIYWVNSEEPDAWTNPNIQLFHQSLLFNPSQGIFEIMRQILAANTSHYQIAFMNISHQIFAAPKMVEILDARLPVGFFTLVPVMFTTMDDIQSILDEKDTKVAALSFLMGCRESAYWLVYFVNSYLLSVPAHLFMGALYCYVYLLVGTSYSLFCVISLIFIAAHVLFQLFICTFLKTARAGRALTIIIFVFIYFFSFLHMFVTLDPNNTSMFMKQILQIIPFSSYIMAVMTMYTQCRTFLPPITWTNMSTSTYNVWWSIYWLMADTVLYLFLFIIFNATNPRAYGTPAIPWKDLFKARAWKKLIFGLDDEFAEGASTSSLLMEVDGLSKTYFGFKTVHAMRDVNFQIRQGEVIIVIGPNGAGKSTLINTLAGMISPTTGHLRLFGKDAQFNDIQSILGICFQENVLLDRLSVREHFEMFGAFRGVPEQEIQEFMEEFTRNLQLEKMIDNRAGDLSGGQKRKLCIALSLLGHPPLVIMDEPAAGVDVEARQVIWKAIASLRDTTTIVTSHALEEAEAVSTRLFIVASGRLAFSGTSTELRKQFKCGYLLRIHGEKGSLEKCLNLVQHFVKDARIIEEKNDTIALDVSDAVPELLEEFEKQKQALGVEQYSFSVEQLEDMLMKLIQTEESQIQGH